MADTSLIELPEEYRLDKFTPEAFVCVEGVITAYTLKGVQQLGRSSEGNIPDIPINNRYVSREHGQFITGRKPV